MHRVNLDNVSSDVQDFLKSLHVDAGEVELELHGKVLCKVVAPAQLAESEKQELLDKVLGQIRRSHMRNKNVPAHVIAREVDQAVKAVRDER